MELDAVEGRVVGSLIEKQLTTPQQYPLTLNSLALACNQTSNRDPVVSYDESEVQSALDSLKAKGLVRFVLPSHGRSVVRYRHVLDEKLALDTRQLSLVAVLLLRGPQTVGELRTRTERMADFAGLGEVESDLEGLARWEEPLVARLERRAGQKEERWAQLLVPDTGSARREEAQGDRPHAPVSASAAVPTAAVPALAVVPDGLPPAVRSEIDGLHRDIEGLRWEVASLRDELRGLRRALGDDASATP